MGIILGFGQYHMDLTKKWCEDILDLVNGDYEKEKIKDYVEKIGKYKNTDFKHIHIRFIEEKELVCGKCILIEGVANHYNDQHPMSPDGFASWQIPFLCTYINDSIWGERKYVSI